MVFEEFPFSSPASGIKSAQYERARYPKRRGHPRRSASEPCMRVSISHRLLSDIAVVIGIRVDTAPHGLVICLFTPPPCGASIPHACARAHSIFSVSNPDHFNITVPTSAYPLAFPEALASWGIPPSCGIRLTPAQYCFTIRIALAKGSSPNGE